MAEQQETSPQSTRCEVRVFISSTFRDMHAERDHLVTVVFPELRERVESLGLEFFDVDLRWGVPAKDANGETANSWEYCRQWIDRVEPFFVCILGQRYGWVPKVEDFKGNKDKERQASDARSITDLEIRHAVLDTKLKRRSYFYLRETPVPAPPQTPPEVYTEFVDTDAHAVTQFVKLRADINTCGRPVRGYACRWTGKAFADLDKVAQDKQFGLMVLEDLWSGVLRDERYVSKEIWRQVLDADPDTDPRYTDESKPVLRELWGKIVALARPASVSPLDAERQQMEAFAASRLRWFQGRTHELQQLTDFIQSTVSDSPRIAVETAIPGQGKPELITRFLTHILQPSTLLRWFQGKRHELQQHTEFIQSTDADSSRLAVVVAIPGQGKSALIAKFSTLIPEPSTFLIMHFVGATERSATAHALVERVLGELDRSGIEWPVDKQMKGEEPKCDYYSLCERLRKRLGVYAGERRVVLLLDALNQLTDGHDLVWLPHRLGPSVRVVVSCVDDSATTNASSVRGERPANRTDEDSSPAARVLRALTLRQPAPLRVPLGPLTKDDVCAIVVEYLKEYCHELDREHLDTLCAIPQTSNPLYLLVMLNELRTLGGNDLNVIVPTRIAAMPHDYPDTVSLFRWVLQRMEVFGAEAVRWWCLYLAHGRVGMASHELADLLVRKLGANTAATALLIERGLRRYLQRRGGQLDFFHGQLQQAVMEEYGQQTDAVTVHSGIADYFGIRWRESDFHALSELPYHQIEANLWQDLERTLSDLNFIETKCAAGMTYRLLADYDAGIARLSIGARYLHALNDFREFVAHDADILVVFPSLVFQQAMNSSKSTLPHSVADHTWREGKNRKMWIRWRNKPEKRTQSMRIRISGSRLLCGAVTSDGERAAIGREDGRLIVFELCSGKHGVDILLNGSAVTACRFLDDSQMLLASTSDGWLFLLDIYTGGIIGSWREHSGIITSINVEPSICAAITTSIDNTARLWRWDRRELTSSEEIHKDVCPVICAAFLQSVNAVAFGTADGRIQIHSLVTNWELIHTEWFHDMAVCCCATTDGGRLLWTAGDDQTIRVTSIGIDGRATFQYRWSLTGNTARITSLCSMPTGDACLVAWSSGQVFELRVEEKSATPIAVFHNSVRCVAPITTGQRVFVAEEDGGITCWLRDSVNTGITEPERPANELAWTGHGEGICALEWDGHVGIPVPGSVPNFSAAVYDSHTASLLKTGKFPGNGWNTTIYASGDCLLLAGGDPTTGYGVQVVDLRCMASVASISTGSEILFLATDQCEPFCGIFEKDGVIAVWNLITFKELWRHTLDESTSREVVGLRIDASADICVVYGAFQSCIFRLSTGDSMLFALLPQSKPANNHGHLWRRFCSRFGTEVIDPLIPDAPTIVWQSMHGTICWLWVLPGDEFLVLTRDRVIRHIDNCGHQLVEIVDNNRNFNPMVAGDWVVTVSSDDWIRVWHLTHREFVMLLPVRLGVSTVALSPTLDSLALGLVDGSIAIFEFVKGGKPDED